MLEILITAGVSGIITGIVTVVSLKTDMAWLKSAVSQHNQRLNKLEGKIL